MPRDPSCALCQRPVRRAARFKGEIIHDRAGDCNPVCREVET